MRLVLIIFALLFSNIASAEFSLVPEQSAITLREDASPQIIKFAIKNNDNITSWNSKEARLIAASILVRDQQNRYLGYNDKSDNLIFIPIGVSDNEKYLQLLVIPAKQYLGGETINAIITSPQIREGIQVTINVPKYIISAQKNNNKNELNEESIKKLLDDSEKTRQVSNLSFYSNIVFSFLLTIIPVTLVGLAYKKTIETATDKTKEAIQEKFTHIQLFQQEVNNQSSNIKTIVSEIKEISRQTETNVSELRIINQQNSPELFQRMSLIIEKIDRDQKTAYDLANYLNQQNNELQQGVLQVHKAVFEMQKDIELSITEDSTKIIFANRELLQEINTKLARLQKEVHDVDHMVANRLSTLHPVDIPEIYDHVEQMLDERINHT